MLKTVCLPVPPENCNYMVLLGQRFGFSLVGVAGSDLRAGAITPTLALLWQLMRAYTLSLLAQLARAASDTNPGYQRTRSPACDLPLISEWEILAWANGRLRVAGKSARYLGAAGFGDPDLRNGLLIIDLLDAIQPGCVDYSLVYPGNTPEVSESPFHHAKLIFCGKLKMSQNYLNFTG